MDLSPLHVARAHRTALFDLDDRTADDDDARPRVPIYPTCSSIFSSKCHRSLVANPAVLFQGGDGRTLGCNINYVEKFLCSAHRSKCLDRACLDRVPSIHCEMAKVHVHPSPTATRFSCAFFSWSHGSHDGDRRCCQTASEREAGDRWRGRQARRRLPAGMRLRQVVGQTRWKHARQRVLQRSQQP